METFHCALAAGKDIGSSIVVSTEKHAAYVENVGTAAARLRWAVIQSDAPLLDSKPPIRAGHHVNYMCKV